MLEASVVTLFIKFVGVSAKLEMVNDKLNIKIYLTIFLIDILVYQFVSISSQSLSSRVSII